MDLIMSHFLEQPKLTKWKKEPSLQDLKKDLASAQQSHNQQIQKIKKWLDNLNVEGEAKIAKKANRSSVVPRLIRKQAEWRYSALSEPFISEKDLFKCDPITWEDREAAIQNQLVLNKQFNTDINRVDFIDEYVRTVVDEGTAIVQVGWEFQEEEYEEEEPVVELIPDESFAETLQQAVEMQQTSPSQYMRLPKELQIAVEHSQADGVSYRPEITEYLTEIKKRTVYNRPTLEVCDYRSVIIDPSAKGKLDKAQFVIKSFNTSLSELKKEGRYKNLDKIQTLSEEASVFPELKDRDDISDFNFEDKARKLFTAYEYWGYWDIEGKGELTPIVATWVGNTLIRMEENPFPDKKLPFVLVQYLPVRKSNYGEPDGALLEDNQLIQGAVLRGMIDLMAKSANAQTGMMKGALDATNRRKYERGMDYEFNPTVDPRLAIHTHTYPEIPSSAQFMWQLQQMEAESLTGVKSYNSGISGASLGDVAVGVRGALDAASKRELGILRRLTRGLIDIARKVMAMNAVFLQEKEIIRITNAEFVEIDREDLKGQIDIRLSISTAEEDNIKAQELAFVLQTMGNTLPMELSKLVLADIVRLRKMPDLAHKIENFQQQPDLVQQQLQQLQLAELQAKVAKYEKEALESEMNAQLLQAKVGLTNAQIGNVQADSDLKSLDFVEQETGVKQARELEKQGAQAKAFAELEREKHELKREEMDNDLIKEYIKNSKNIVK